MTEEKFVWESTHAQGFLTCNIFRCQVGSVKFTKRIKQPLQKNECHETCSDWSQCMFFERKFVSYKCLNEELFVIPEPVGNVDLVFLAIK